MVTDNGTATPFLCVITKHVAHVFRVCAIKFPFLLLLGLTDTAVVPGALLATLHEE